MSKYYCYPLRKCHFPCRRMQLFVGCFLHDETNKAFKRLGLKVYQRPLAGSDSRKATTICHTRSVLALYLLDLKFCYTVIITVELHLALQMD